MQALISALRSALEGNAPALTTFDDDTELALIRTAASDGQAGLQAVLDRGDYAPYHEAIQLSLQPIPFLAAELWRTIIPPKFLYKNLVMEARGSLISGKEGVGKSFFVLMLANELARLGHTTVLVSYEDFAGLGDRQEAYEIQYGHTARDQYPQRLFAMSRDMPLIHDEDSFAVFQQQLMMLPVAPDAILFDTLSAATPGMEENSNTEVGLVLYHLRCLREQYKCATVLIHHDGKASGARRRGADVLGANIDLVYEMSREPKTDRAIKLHCHKNKWGPRALDQRIDLLPVELSTGKKSLAAVWSNLPPDYGKKYRPIVDVLTNKPQSRNAVASQVDEFGKDTVGKRLEELRRMGLANNDRGGWTLPSG